uniref:Endonuclease/exonuclease/phosphatase domain-containing protein n=1 Tax=Leptobrachium leishanense TaxID=445787 RepID=A0A8C5M552_9ANUR
MYAPGSLHCVSYNVRGLNSPEKRRKILRELRAQKTSIAFLQETHFKQDMAPAFRDSYFPLGFFGNYDGGKARGTAIIMSREVPFVETGLRADPAGRFLFVKGTIAETKYTFASIYLPNKSQHRSLATILRLLSIFQEGILILAGDFNVAMDPKIDTSLGESSLPRNILTHIKRTLDRYQLVDVWRALHGTEREYSFYSPVHANYSRIDYFFLSQHQISTVRSSAIHTGTWSDHAPLSIHIVSPLQVPRERSWKLNLTLLNDPIVLQEVKTLLTDYFQDNLTPDIPLSTVWEAHKAVIRGLLICKGTAAKKLRQTQIKDLFLKVNSLEALHADNGDPSTYQSLLEARKALTEHLSSDLKYLAVKTGAFYALNENKPGKLLAHILRTRRSRAYIPRLRLPSGQVTVNPDMIAGEFCSYFTKLYSIQTSQFPQLNMNDITQYLQRTIHRSLTCDEAEALGSRIGKEELTLAIKQSKAHKSPGPDGLPAEYFKIVQEELLPHMLSTFNAILEEGTFHPSTWQQPFLFYQKQARTYYIALATDPFPSSTPTSNSWQESWLTAYRGIYLVW